MGNILSAGIVIACDVIELHELRELVEETNDVDGVVGYKVGFSTCLTHGLVSVMKEIRNLTGKFVIYDHQKAATDIPATGKLFAAVCKRAQLDGAILFPFAGPETQKLWIAALLQEGIKPIVGALMTHPKFLNREGGYIVDAAPETIFKIALAEGVDYFVLPGTKLELANALAVSLGEKARFFIPGVGSQGGTITKIAEQLPLERCFPIVGSAIYNARGKRKAAKAFALEYKSVIERIIR